MVKKKCSFKTKNVFQHPTKYDDNGLSLNKRSSRKLNGLHVNNKNDSDKKLKITKNNNLQKGNLYILLTRLPFTNSKIIFNSSNNNTNGYTNLENYIRFNEVQICDKIVLKLEPTTLKNEQREETQQKVITPKADRLKNKISNHSVTNQNADQRITRGKALKLQTEKRKQLDKIMFDKFPKNTFKMFAIQLNDINKEVEFLRTLGLICRFKSSLSVGKIKYS